MSQVVKAIVATDTGERKYIPKGMSLLFQDIFTSKATVQEVHSAEYLGEIALRYDIGVRVGTTCLISPCSNSLDEKDNIAQAIKRTKKQVIEGIFGEFRQDFRRIERALYKYQYEEAAKLLYAMEYKMFEEYE